MSRYVWWKALAISPVVLVTGIGTIVAMITQVFFDVVFEPLEEWARADHD